MLKNKILSFVLFSIFTFSASFIGGWVSINLKEPWYSTLLKSDYNPPDWVFAPVWTILYFMMTIAIWKFWHSKNRDMNTVYIYFIHIIFNTTWSIVFCISPNIYVLIVLIILIIFIITLVIRFKRVNMLSYYLMILFTLVLLYYF